MPAADSTTDSSNPPSAAAPIVPPLRKRLISAAVWSFAGRGAAIGLFFVTQVVLTHALTKAEVASYNLAASVASFLAAVVSLGTHQILSRAVRQTLYGPHPERTEGIIRACAKLLAAGCILTAIAFLVVTPRVVDDGADYALLRDFSLGVAAWACLSGWCINSSFALQGLDDFRASTLVGSRRGGILTNGAFFLFALGAWATGLVDMRTFIVAQVVFSLAAVIYGRWAIRRRLDLFTTPQQRAAAEPGPAAVWYLRESLPYWVALLTTMALDELDAPIAAKFISTNDVANYTVVKHLIRLMATPFVMFSASMGPFAAELLAKGEKARLERIMRASTTLVSVPMLAVFAAYLLVPQLVLRLAYGPEYVDAAPILQIMTIGQVLFVVMGNSAQVLLMAGRQKVLMICSAICLAAYAILAGPLMREYGATGAAALLTAIVGGQAVAQTILCRTKVGVWTIATLSPAAIKDALRALRGRRRVATAADPAAPEGTDDL